MKKFNLFSYLMNSFEKQNGRRPSFGELSGLAVIYILIMIIFKFITSTSFLFLVSVSLIWAQMENSNQYIHWALIGFNSFIILLTIKRFWIWVKHPIHTIDGKLPTKEWYENEQEKLTKKYEEKEDSNNSLTIQKLKLSIHWWLETKQLKYSIPENPLEKFTSKIFFSMIIIVLCYAFIYISLTSIGNGMFVIADISSLSKIERIITFVYFSVVTFATVGYGDIYPVASISRIFTTIEVISGMFMLIIGVAYLSMFTLPKINAANSLFTKKSKSKDITSPVDKSKVESVENTKKEKK